jgi:hypothetical protein
MRTGLLQLLLILCAAALGAGLVVGCASDKQQEHPTYIPLDASLAATGAAPISTLAYPGQAYYVTEDNRHALVFSSRVPTSMSGAMIVKVDRERKAVVISPTKERDPELVLLENINPNSHYSIWLSESRSSWNAATTQPSGT